jgi:hypothetical protein
MLFLREFPNQASENKPHIEFYCTDQACNARVIASEWLVNRTPENTETKKKKGQVYL